MPTIIGDVFSLSTVYDNQVKNVEDNTKFKSWPESDIKSFWVSGLQASGTYTTTIVRLDFSTEINTQIASTVTVGRQRMGSVESNIYGYIAGGQLPAVPTTSTTLYSTINRIDLSTETTSLPSPKLTVARSFAAGSSYETFGYFCAGARAPFSTYYSGIDRMSFSDEVVVATSNSLVSGFVRSGGFSNNLIGSGYFFGSASSIERLDYKTNSTSAIPNVLPTIVGSAAATVSASSSYITGDGPISVASLQRFDFSTETAQLLPATLSSSRRYVAGGQSFHYGYYSGGYPPLSVSISSMDRLDFSTESVSLSNNLPAIRGFHTAVSGGQSR